MNSKEWMNSKALVLTTLLAGSTLSACSTADNKPVPPPADTNAAPVVSAVALSAPDVLAGASVDLTVTATDADGDALSYAFSLGTCEGTLSLPAGTLQDSNVVTFTAAYTASGECQLGVTVADGQGHTTEGQATLTVHGNSCSLVSTSPAVGPVSEKVVLDCGCVPTASACSCSNDLSNLKPGCAVDPTSCQVVCQGALVVDQGNTTVAYNALPYDVLSCTHPSQGFEASGTREFGDQVLLAGTGTTIKSMNVLFSVWACQSGHTNTNDCVTSPGSTFTHPITASIYAVASCDDASCPGELLGSATRTLTFPYRPSGDSVHCTDANAGKWYSPVSGLCQNGLPSVQAFDLSELNIAVPADRQVIWTVAYNTSNAGYNPLGEQACTSEPGGCPYDALNVGAMTQVNAPYAGSDVEPNVVFMSLGATPLGANADDWAGYTPESEIITN